MGRVEGKVAFVTGVARGQGRSHAIRLAEEGADIIGVDICEPVPGVGYPAATEADLQETVKAVEALDRRIVVKKMDVRDHNGLKGFVSEAVGQMGRLDIAAINHGIVIMRPWDQVTESMWDEQVSINLKGVWNSMQAVVPHMIAGGNGGSIIITSSAAGLKGLPFLVPYVAAKHGVVGIMRAYAAELAEHNIRVNTIHPTGVETPMGADPEMQANMGAWLGEHPTIGGMFANMLPIQSTQPRDQSNAVLFLASDEARYITSVTLPVDAGNTQY